MSRKSIYLLILLVAAVLCSCQKQRPSGFDDEGNLHGRISISGAWAMYPLAVKWAEEFRREHPGVRIDISAGGAGKGMADVLGNMVDLAMVSREVTEAEVGKGAWFIAVAKDAVVPTFSTMNPHREIILQQGLTREQFQVIFLQAGSKTWESFLGINGNTPMNTYTRSDACGAAEVWAWYLDKHQEDLKGVGVFGDPGIADIVKKDRYGIGYNNIAFAFDISTRKPFKGLGIIPLDVNGNRIIDSEEDFYDDLDQLMEAVALGHYPAPPARDLYFVSRGEPHDVAVREFLAWILEKGQQYVSEAGYVRLEGVNTNLIPDEDL
jgi:phosphate transport system substrate-binding protein